MARVTGIGGIMFKSPDPERLYQWYEKHLGIKRGDYGVSFKWADDPQASEAQTAWAIFKSESKYFDPSQAPFMVNYRVEGLKELLAKMRAEGASVDEKYEETDYGNFGWVMDPDGNKIELWEPKAS